MRHAAALVASDTALADAGHYAGHDHRLCREELGMWRAVAAPNPRDAGDRWPKAPYRRALHPSSPAGLCRQRRHAGSAFGRHKRRLGSALAARGTTARQRGLAHRVPTHNLAFLAGAGLRVPAEQQAL